MYIPSSDEDALDKLKDEQYLRERYQQLRNEGQSIEQAFAAVWNMIEIRSDEINWILVLLAEDLRTDTVHGLVWERNARLHEKLRSFQYADPETETYLLSKVIGQ